MSAAPRETRRKALPAALACALLCAAVVLGERAMCARLERWDVLARDETLFDADPESRLRGLAHNWLRNVTIAHPNFGHFFATPIRALAGAAHALSLAPGDDQERTRDAIGLWVAPLAAGAKTACLFGLAWLLGMGWIRATLLAAVGALSFSQLLFGCLPETYGPSGLALALAYLLLALDLRRGREPRWPAWLAVGVLTTGITITNVAAVALLFLFATRAAGRPLGSSILRTTGFGALCLSINAVLALAGNLAYGQPVDLARELAHKSTHAAGSSPAFAGRMAALPGALADTFAPPAPIAGYIPDPSDEAMCIRVLELPSDPAPRATWLGLAVLALILAGALLTFAARGPWRTLGSASLAVLAFNAALHAGWGSAPFLYSQHWHLSALVLLAIPLAAGERLKRPRTAALALLALALAVHNAALARDVSEKLRAGPLYRDCSSVPSDERLR